MIGEMVGAGERRVAEPRKRTSRACDSCFATRLRCDGRAPCVRCQADRKSCQYSRSVKKRGPKPRQRKSYIPLDHPRADDQSIDHSYRDRQDAIPEEECQQYTPTADPSTPGSAHSRITFAQATYINTAPSGFPDSSSPSNCTSLAELSEKHGVATQGNDSFEGPTPSRRLSRSYVGSEDLRTMALVNGRPIPRQVVSECRYLCLEPILPVLQGLLDPEVACDLLDHYFTKPNTSLFNSASPYILDPILRRDSLLCDENPRETSPALLLTMLWVCAHTANVEALLAPGKRVAVCGRLRQIAMERLNTQGKECWNQWTAQAERQSNQGDCTHDRERFTAHEKPLLDPPCQSLDDLLALILVAVVVSGTDIKSATIPWWQRAVRTAESMRLNFIDQKDNRYGEVFCPNIPCTCSRARKSAFTWHDIERQEEQRRVMWLLFALDRHWALCYNCTPLVLDQDYRIYDPIPDHIWNGIDPLSEVMAVSREYGPKLVVSGTGFFEFFLPLMAILGDIIRVHHTYRHPRLGCLDMQQSNALIEHLLETCFESIEELASQSGNPRYAAASGSRVDINHSQRVDAPRSSRHSSDDLSAQKRKAIVHLYANFMLHVLYVLLYGRWDALSMMSTETTFSSVESPSGCGSAAQIELSEWIASTHFSNCASHAILASETLSLILSSDPELAFTPYLFGIYLLQGSFILLLFAYRMPQVGGGRNESVERACETIIRAHEISFATLSVEFQRDFRKILRATLNSVREVQHYAAEGKHDTWRKVLGLYRWTDGTRGLAP